MKTPISIQALRRFAACLLAACSLALVSCETPAQSATAGALGGAAAGAIIGNQSGHAAEGALIGGAAGGLGGYGVGKAREQRRYRRY